MYTTSSYYYSVYLYPVETTLANKRDWIVQLSSFHFLCYSFMVCYSISVYDH